MSEKISQIENYFYNNKKNLIHKWDHYFEIYDRHFKKYKGKDVVLLEVGVSKGGSLQMWSDYFGEGSKFYGIDVDPRCKEFENENTKIFIGSQSDRKFLGYVKDNIPPVDILIDDGGHYMNQQIILFEELFGYVKKNGVYFCEDTHSSYWLVFGGGYKRRGTFIEYSKNFIDMLNAYHSEQSKFKINNFTKSVNSIHYYDSVLVIEKRKREKPKDVVSGIISFGGNKKENYKPNYKPFFKNKFLQTINRILRIFNL
jgi:hypothetical protein